MTKQYTVLVIPPDALPHQLPATAEGLNQLLMDTLRVGRTLYPSFTVISTAYNSKADHSIVKVNVGAAKPLEIHTMPNVMTKLPLVEV